MRYAYDKFTTRVVSRKSNLQLAYDCRVRHEECCGLLKHVLKPYDNRSDRQFYFEEIVYDFSMTRAARAIKIACDNRKQKSYRVNQPLDNHQKDSKMQKCLSKKVIKGRKTEIKYMQLVSFHSYHIDSTSVSWYLFFIKVDSRSIMSPSSAVLVFLWLWLSLRSLVINSNSAQSTCIHVHAVSIISRMVVLSTTRNFLVP